MRGRMPKDPALRQRRNSTAPRATLAPESEEKRRAPSLPKRYGRPPEDTPGAKAPEIPWHRMTVAWWHDIWHSPMAEEFLRADVHALYRLAVLVDQFWASPSKELAAEIRLQQQCFGLTPID